MKYDVAMHLLANGIIKEEQYELVSKLLNGVRLSHEDVERAEEQRDPSYGFYGQLGKSNYTSDLELTREKERFILDYETAGMKMTVIQNKNGEVELHVRKANYTKRLRDQVDGYYVIDKEKDAEEIVVRFYDKEAYDLAKRLDFSSEYLETEHFERVGLLPDEEVIVKNVDVVDFASSLIRPYTSGIGSFEETIDSIRPTKQKILTKE